MKWSVPSSRRLESWKCSFVRVYARSPLRTHQPRVRSVHCPSAYLMTDNHKGPLRPEGEDLLQVCYVSTSTRSFSPSVCPQAALADPFSVPNLPRISPFQPANATTPLVPTEAAPPEPSEPALPPATPTSPESSVSPAEFDAWKAEYESQVVEWRRQSATARARAEAERARWEERRAHEEQQQEGADGRQHASEVSVELGGASTGTSEWDAVSHRSTLAPSAGHPMPASPARGGPAQGEHPHPQVTSFFAPRRFVSSVSHKDDSRTSLRRRPRTHRPRIDTRPPLPLQAQWTRPARRTGRTCHRPRLRFRPCRSRSPRVRTLPSTLTPPVRRPLPPRPPWRLRLRPLRCSTTPYPDARVSGR